MSIGVADANAVLAVAVGGLRACSEHHAVVHVLCRRPAVHAPHTSRARRRACGRAVPCTRRRHRAESSAHSAPTEAVRGRWPIATIVTKSLRDRELSELSWVVRIQRGNDLLRPTKGEVVSWEAALLAPGRVAMKCQEAPFAAIAQNLGREQRRPTYYDCIHASGA